MDLPLDPDDQAFQREVREFMASALPARLRDCSERGLHPGKAELGEWQKELYRKGWIAPAWPREHGGPGWSPVRRYVYNREYFHAGAPQVSPFGLSMVGPVIYTFGTDSQKSRFLGDILRSETWWCQGFSEPGAGSDLARLRTRAVRDGEHYVVSGQKIWTSFAHFADMMFCLVRTDPEARPQEGISFLLIDMGSPGVEVRPIMGIDGAHTLNEVFLDEVRVPVANRVGEENRGWSCAKFLLGHERMLVARVARSQFQLARLKRLAAAERRGKVALTEDDAFRHRIARIEIDLMALEALELRYLSLEQSGTAPAAGPSLLKARGAEVAQAIKALLVDSLGPYGAALLPEDADGIGPDHLRGALQDHLYQRAATIYGGSNEIQREIVAKELLR